MGNGTRNYSGSVWLVVHSNFREVMLGTVSLSPSLWWCL